MHYGLAEKSGKGEIRVTDLALGILHPENPSERRAALNQAGFNPQLFRELRERYSGNPPSPSNLESYLSREGFASAAINPASRAYLETCRFLEQEDAYESDVVERESASESRALIPVKEDRSVQHVQIPAPTAHQATSLTPGLRSDVFTLQGGGEIIANLPDALTQRDYDDLKDWLELMQRKAERKVEPAAPVPAAESPKSDQP
jgi:hypothetical protein